MRLILALVLSFFCFGSFADECSSINAQTENSSEYLSKMAESLTNIKIQFQKIRSLRSKKSADATDALVALKELKASYFCSSNMIASYKRSKIENISQSAEALAQSYQMLGKDVDESIADIKSALDGKTKGTAGDQADKSANTMIRVKKMWELVIMAISIGTYSAIGKENPKTKKTDTLIISKADRNKIVKTLKEQFSFPMKGDRDPIDAAADIYFSFLNQSWNFK